jgi:hypothetical protein
VSLRWLTAAGQCADDRPRSGAVTLIIMLGPLPQTQTRQVPSPTLLTRKIASDARARAQALRAPIFQGGATCAVQCRA